MNPLTPAAAHAGRPSRAVAALLLELACWALPAAVFLAIYVLRFGQPIASIAPHLAVLLCFALGFAGLRLALATARCPAWLVRLISVPLAGIALLALLAFYAIAAIGLANWGRVGTWPLVTPYLLGWRELMGALGLPAWLAPAGASLALIVALIVTDRLLRAQRWPSTLIAHTSKPFRLSLIAAAALLAGFQVYQLVIGQYGASAEPITLALHPQLSAEQTGPIDVHWRERLDAAAKAEAAAYRPSAARPARNVVLVVGDALRPTRMSLFGYGRPTTPNLDRLRRAERIHYAKPIMTACAESFCGLIALSRSKYVHQTSKFDLNLVRVLQLHGYRTQLILGGDHTNFYGLADWLGPADSYWDGTHTDGYVNDDYKVIEQARGLPRWDGRPTFLQFHLMSTHALGKRHDAALRYQPALNYYRIANAEPEVDHQAARVGNFYDNGVTQFDALLSELLDTLKAGGYLHDAVVIVTGDHGEMLGEHAQYSHAKDVFQPALEVPLVVLRFGYDGAPLDAAARMGSQLDVAPSILDELGLPVPPGWIGVPLTSTASRDFLMFQQGRNFGVVDFRHSGRVLKFWRNTGTRIERLHDLTADPGEQKNLIAGTPAKLRAEWLQQIAPAVEASPLR